MHILIAGCGYIGHPLALSLIKQNHQVTGWVFSQASGQRLSALGINTIVADLTQPSSWLAHHGRYDVLVYCPSTRGGSAEDYRQIYVEGLKLSVSALAPGGRLFYTSSTSVYAQGDGVWVDETSPTEPEAETSRLLLQAESVALAAEGTVLRLSAIYGPGRGVLLRRFLEGTPVAAGNPDRYLNQIHQADVVAAVNFFLQNPSAERGVYNLSDDQPSTHREIYSWLAERLKKPLPAFSGETALRKRGNNNRRISNLKFKTLGWSPIYPSYKESYLDLLPKE